MKTFILMAALTVFSLILFVISDHWRFKESDYISDEVLDRSNPINVTIDAEFLKGFNPAYAKSR